MSPRQREVWLSRDSRVPDFKSDRTSEGDFGLLGMLTIAVV